MVIVWVAIDQFSSLFFSPLGGHKVEINLLHIKRKKPGGHQGEIYFLHRKTKIPSAKWRYIKQRSDELYQSIATQMRIK